MSLKSRLGFTMVELLMVITIIGLLTALLLPAVSSARESARRVQCVNKMHELGAAVIEFEEKNNGYPGWLHYPFHILNYKIGRNVKIGASWFPQLLPYVGRNDLFDPAGRSQILRGAWKTPDYDNPNNPGQPTVIVLPLRRLLVCPSDAEKMDRDAPEISYVANCGRPDSQPSTTTDFPTDWNTNAVFLNLWNRTVNGKVVNNYRKRQNSSYVSGKDGLEHTLLLSENNDAVNWHDIGEPVSGMVFWHPNQLKPIHHINGQGTASNSYDTARPSSNHIGGVNMMFTGGRVQFVSQDIDYWVFAAMMTPNGGYAKEPGSNSDSPALIQNQPKIVLD